MGQYYKAVVLADRADGRSSYGMKVFAFPGSMKLTEHSWNGNSDVAEVVNEVVRWTSLIDVKVRVAWVGDYSRGWFRDTGKQGIHEEAYIAAWGRYHHIEPTRGHPAFGRLYAVDDDLKEAVEIWGVGYREEMEKEHGEWWMCAWPILNAVGNGQGGGDYHGVNEGLAGRWAYHRQRIVHRPPYGYRELPAHLFAEGGMSERPAQEVSL